MKRVRGLRPPWVVQTESICDIMIGRRSRDLQNSRYLATTATSNAARTDALPAAHSIDMVRCVWWHRTYSIGVCLFLSAGLPQLTTRASCPWRALMSNGARNVADMSIPLTDTETLLLLNPMTILTHASLGLEVGTPLAIPLAAS
jgi:hypothetical protein